MDFGDWFDYIRGMEKEIEKGDYVLHVVYYEDMKEVTLNSFIASGDLNSFIASGDFSSADNLCKQFGLKSGPTERRSRSGS